MIFKKLPHLVFKNNYICQKSHVLLILYKLKKVSMTRKYHNHTLQTNPWYHKEEPQDPNAVTSHKEDN